MKRGVYEYSSWHAGVPVTLYQGQLDVICCTIGAQAWMRRLHWHSMKGFHDTPRRPFFVPDQVGTVGILCPCVPFSPVVSSGFCLRGGRAALVQDCVCCCSAWLAAACPQRDHHGWLLSRDRLGRAGAQRSGPAPKCRPCGTALHTQGKEAVNNPFKKPCGGLPRALLWLKAWLYPRRKCTQASAAHFYGFQGKPQTLSPESQQGGLGRQRSAAGFVKEHRQLALMTVNRAGHMAPIDQPAVARHMVLFRSR